MSEADLVAEAPAEASLPANIPYAFAKRFGVALLREEDGRLVVAIRVR